jgi:hypothetical protein
VVTAADICQVVTVRLTRTIGHLTVTGGHGVPLVFQQVTVPTHPVLTLQAVRQVPTMLSATPTNISTQAIQHYTTKLAVLKTIETITTVTATADTVAYIIAIITVIVTVIVTVTAKD